MAPSSSSESSPSAGPERAEPVVSPESAGGARPAISASGPGTDQGSGPTALQLGIAALILGTSAGFTLYTRKADSMLRRMGQVTEKQLRRERPVFGPPTKEHVEKMKPRIDKDEFF